MSTAIPVNIRSNSLNAPLHSDYSTTPHGTIYSSTPGGTRVIYDRTTLLALSSSQLAQTPPTGMAYVAGVTRSSHAEIPTAHGTRKTTEQKKVEEEKKKTYNPFAVLNNDGDDDMFDMEE
ncbi:eukaryotic translation initiation factor 4E binding protein [Phycomyces blakesleeanus]|uniref:Eukaryotic translation initiation factor 4E binding protein n=2 Tax=Phycomyces blakesleeanus TaxID=4837 RepID=A0A162WAF6_PHYB8|nr:hypothetical protein PHYBLDRAFT_184056 [Phycomyces blakesleeanus NRRL 1555(-)]KAI9013924.1 eukaryotic translation initiation factor 4E binding protein [Phycomyces nitens]OAD65855.1 hypothetical protein PHYBLDRAFT_184056 [Phycomyces blakesleeanus NRRL 1555(-)]|eukprot:XP_018283895.1 hypothetical protein PHYBLDRAFT_184056 [Phycomyces blakesleeanus NRRL 1555(-)]